MRSSTMINIQRLLGRISETFISYTTSKTDYQAKLYVTRSQRIMTQSSKQQVLQAERGVVPLFSFPSS